MFPTQPWVAPSTWASLETGYWQSISSIISSSTSHNLSLFVLTTCSSLEVHTWELYMSFPSHTVSDSIPSSSSQGTRSAKPLKSFGIVFCGRIKSWDDLRPGMDCGNGWGRYIGCSWKWYRVLGGSEMRDDRRNSAFEWFRSLWFSSDKNRRLIYKSMNI